MLVLHIASQDNLKYLLLGQASKFPLLYFLTPQGQAEYSKSKILNATKTPRLTSPGFTLINGRLSHHITMGCTQGQVKHPLFLMKLVSSSLQMYTHPTFLLGSDCIHIPNKPVYSTSNASCCLGLVHNYTNIPKLGYFSDLIIYLYTDFPQLKPPWWFVSGLSGTSC